MRRPEQNLYDTLKRNKPKGCLIMRVENETQPGMPDVFLQFKDTGLNCWVELKVATVPAKLDTRLLKKDAFQKSQPGWHLQYTAHGGRSVILIRDDKKNLYVVPGHHIERIKELSYYQMTTRYRVGDWAEAFETMGEDE